MARDAAKGDRASLATCLCDVETRSHQVDESHVFDIPALFALASFNLAREHGRITTGEVVGTELAPALERVDICDAMEDVTGDYPDKAARTLHAWTVAASNVDAVAKPTAARNALLAANPPLADGETQVIEAKVYRHARVPVRVGSCGIDGRGFNGGIT